MLQAKLMQRLFCLLWLTLALLTAGCGVKGDLYLPEDADKTFTTATIPTSTQPTP